MTQPFSVLKTLAGEKANDTSTTLSGKMEGWMNRFYEKVWMNYNWKEITVIDATITLTASQNEQVMPKECTQIITLTERDLDAILSPTSPFVYQQKYLDTLGTNAGPLAFVEAGRC